MAPWLVVMLLAVFRYDYGISILFSVKDALLPLAIIGLVPSVAGFGTGLFLRHKFKKV